jgi:glutaminase
LPGVQRSDPDQATSIYTEQCSVNVNAKDLAEMAATLANGGVNPVTHKKVLEAKYVPEVLAVMATAAIPAIGCSKPACRQRAV